MNEINGYIMFREIRRVCEAVSCLSGQWCRSIRILK